MLGWRIHRLEMVIGRAGAGWCACQWLMPALVLGLSIPFTLNVALGNLR